MNGNPAWRHVDDDATLQRQIVDAHVEEVFRAIHAAALEEGFTDDPEAFARFRDKHRPALEAYAWRQMLASINPTGRH